MTPVMQKMTEVSGREGSWSGKSARGLRWVDVMVLGRQWGENCVGERLTFVCLYNDFAHNPSLNPHSRPSHMHPHHSHLHPSWSHISINFHWQVPDLMQKPKDPGLWGCSKLSEVLGFLNQDVKTLALYVIPSSRLSFRNTQTCKIAYTIGL